MNETETRDEQYLRILTSGIRGESDYEAVKYLKDKGYTDSPILLSNGRDTHGKVINTVWRGPNSNGLDFIDELRARIERNDSKFNQNNKPDDSTMKSLDVFISHSSRVFKTLCQPNHRAMCSSNRPSK